MIRRNIFAALGATALLGLAGGVAVSSVTSGFSLSSESYGAYVNTVTGSLAQTPLAVLPGSGMVDADAPSASVPGLLEVKSLFAINTGSGGAGDAGAQSIASADRLSILDGLITADGLVAMSTTYADGTTLVSEGAGTIFANLTVAGVLLEPELAPNTRIDLPGVGYAVLNEQIPSGDGVFSTGLRVNGIHVLIQDQITGVTTGEIVVASAYTTLTQ